MTEGTKSYLIGCHNFIIHPLCVLIAWILEYKSVPRPWQIVCIFIHDIGIVGKQYLSNPEGKKDHWLRGAQRAYDLYGAKGYCFVAGHASGSGYPRSKLWKADKRSWLVAPTWWLWSNYYIEWHNSGVNITRPHVWRKLVKQNLESEEPLDSHELYLKHSNPQYRGPK